MKTKGAILFEILSFETDLFEVRAKVWREKVDLMNTEADAGNKGLITPNTDVAGPLSGPPPPQPCNITTTTSLNKRPFFSSFRRGFHTTGTLRKTADWQLTFKTC